MKYTNKYILTENNKILKKSVSLEKLINFTVNTTNAKIYYNNNLIWIQNTSEYYNK